MAMRVGYYLLVLLLLQQRQQQCFAFTVIVPSVIGMRRQGSSNTFVVRFLSSSDSSSQQPPSSSRLAGNQREPTQQEIQVMDEMIYKLSNAKPYELPTAVQRAYRVISSPRFFVRIAELTDQAADNPIQQEQLKTLATNLVATLEAIVSSAEDKIQEFTTSVETVVKAAAEPDTGEFLVPLTMERIGAMQTAINNLDPICFQGDTFVSTLDAWMNKSHLDGMDLMVGILQKVLQLYIGRRLFLVGRQSSSNQVEENNNNSPTERVFQELLQTDADSWDTCIRQYISNNNDTVTSPAADSLIAEIQRQMEVTVLSLESGSITQQVLAEYLQEMVRRVEYIQKAV